MRRWSAELALAALALAASLAMSLYWGFVLAAQQQMWPFPGLYLVETAALPALVCAASWRGWPWRTRLASAAAGALAAFSILGALSIGFFYLPATALLLAAALAGRRVTGEGLAMGAAFFVAGAVAQAALMLLLISVS